MQYCFIAVILSNPAKLSSNLNIQETQQDFDESIYSNGKSLVLLFLIFLLFIKKISRRKIGYAKFYIRRHHIILVHVYTSFLTVTGKQG